MTNAFARASEQLRIIHEVLRRNLGRFARFASEAEHAARVDLTRFVELNLRLLTLHHEAEDDVAFPVLRAAGRLRSTDAAFLDAKSVEHRDMQRRIESLARHVGAAQGRGKRVLPQLAQEMVDLNAMLWPHLETEEGILTPEHLEEMIDEATLDRMLKALAARERARGGPMLLMLLATSMTDGERQVFFAEIPWFVRKVLVRHVWRRAFRTFLPFSVQPDLRGI